MGRLRRGQRGAHLLWCRHFPALPTGVRGHCFHENLLALCGNWGP
jgi:hypothetical protein